MQKPQTKTTGTKKRRAETSTNENKNVLTKSKCQVTARKQLAPPAAEGKAASMCIGLVMGKGDQPYVKKVDRKVVELARTIAEDIKKHSRISNTQRCRCTSAAEQDCTLT